jgi:hypothetical protein
MLRDRRCKVCRWTTSANGTPVVVVAVRDGEDVYACDVHRGELADPLDQLVLTAQLQDMARRR